MAKGPASPEKQAQEAVRDLTAAFGRDLTAVSLYGSATGPDYQPRVSDINLLVVLTEKGLGRLSELASRAAAWPKMGLALPLILGPGDLEQSLDAFPLEFLNIKLSRKVLIGPDVMAQVEINPADLRLQCEREMRGKLLLLRQALLAGGGKEAALKQTARDSIKAFVAIFRGVLVLLGKDPAGLTAMEVLDRAANELELTDGSVFNQIRDLGNNIKGSGKIKELFDRYLDSVAQAVEKIDSLQT